MEYLKELERNISLLDGMLIETGGKFGENALDGYIHICIELADRYYQDNKEKKELLPIVDAYISNYKLETAWKYYNYETRFLSTLKAHIEEL